MDNAMVLLYDLCRLCLDEPGVDNIFQPVDLSQDILTYTGIQVTLSDKLPLSICNSCRDIITCVKVLKDVATANDQRLKRICGNSDSNGDNQVLMTDSDSHLVIITPTTIIENESSDISKISSSSESSSFKSQIVYESDMDSTEELNSKTEKQNSKKRKSSKPENMNSFSKEKIRIRKDLFDSSATVTSSTRRSMECLPSTSSQTPDQTPKMTSSTKMKKQSQTSTSRDTKIPIKIVKIGDKTVFQYEYICEVCNKTYATPKKLYLHQLAHDKKFHCPLDTCCKRFATKGDLQKHIRSHTGEKPYKCDLCKHSFTQNVTLKAHKESKHVEKHN